MAQNLPYMLSPGLISKIIEKIQQARRPDRFTQDFLGTKLGHPGGSAMAIIPLLKRMGFIASDGTPTALYDRLRNSETEGGAIAEGLRAAYTDLFERNEYVQDLSRDKLTALVTEITGATKEDRTTKAIVGTFWTLKDMADFDADGSNQQPSISTLSEEKILTPVSTTTISPNAGIKAATEAVDFKVSYTINLNLPETTNPDVFNAIFKSLKENLLRE